LLGRLTIVRDGPRSAPDTDYPEVVVLARSARAAAAAVSLVSTPV
jgi:hypothetical protein